MDGLKRQNISFNEFELDTTHNQLLCRGKPVAIYTKTFELLEFLVQNNGRILTKDEILQAVWEGQIVEEANLSVQISALRKALGEKKDSPKFLITIPGKGYKFVADLTNGAEIVIEKQKLSKIVIDEEFSDAEQTDVAVNQTGNFFSGKNLYLLGGAVLLLILLGISFGFYKNSNWRKAALPFENAKLKRLTNSGIIECVAMSPDGKYLAYVLGESDGNILRLRQIGTASDVEILPPKKESFWGINFSPDGNWVAYSSGQSGRREIYVRPFPDVEAGPELLGARPRDYDAPYSNTRRVQTDRWLRSPWNPVNWFGGY